MEPDPGGGRPRVRPLLPPDALPLRLEGVFTGSGQLFRCL